MKIAIFWDIAPCIPYINRRFGGMYRFHLQGRKSTEQETSDSRCFLSEHGKMEAGGKKINR
jgi:hypothetical protein